MQVVQEVRKYNAFPVRGNNDDKALAAWEAWQRGEEIPEILEWVKDLPEDDYRWMSQMPWSISFPPHKLIVVHGGLIPNVSPLVASQHSVILAPTPACMDVLRHSPQLPVAHKIEMNHAQWLQD